MQDYDDSAEGIGCIEGYSSELKGGRRLILNLKYRRADLSTITLRARRVVGGRDVGMDQGTLAGLSGEFKNSSFFPDRLPSIVIVFDSSRSGIRF